MQNNSSYPPEKLHHGGRLRAAAVRYNLPLENWVDLSTGINPNGWRVEAIPAAMWQRLPEDDDELVEVACQYYGAPALLPVAGSQAAIQALPQLRSSSRVGILNPGYAEHAHAWQRANHRVKTVTPDQINDDLPNTDVLVIINPNNPTGAFFPIKQLLDWHAQLAERGGWLIVDEAFMDVTPEQSIASYAARPGLIVLRSLGKFFGLAGVRVGFVCAHETFLAQLDALLGPWTISTASRWVATHALQDSTWHETTRHRLIQKSKRLQLLLSQHNLSPDGGCAFFQWMWSSQAESIHEMLAHQGILARLFTTPLSLRFGLPDTEADWSRLNKALKGIADNKT
ncbi:MAG: threonine-phosphate decarboxylase CobD [Nitrosomonas sp.]|nr:threonine-phosphate decarboxylase CobD [Nitrosomonas sp.]MDP1950231.1 threonine-phosphate decarboxylase CobD [Nitrosomonas sp.]